MHISRKTRARHPNRGLPAAFVDTSRFTYQVPDDATSPRQIPLIHQTPIVRFPPGSVKDPATNALFSTLDNGNTEVVFTRVWLNPRAIIGNITLDHGNSGYTAFELPAMRNPATADGSFTYPEGDLAEVNTVSSLDAGLTFEENDPVTKGEVKPWSVETWNRGWLENNRKFVDQQGEWYLDDVGAQLALFYKPRKDPNRPNDQLQNENVYSTTNPLRFQIPVTFTLVSVEGVSGVPAKNGQPARDEQPVSGFRIIGKWTCNLRSGNNACVIDEAKASKVHSADFGLKFRYSAWQYENGRIDEKRDPVTEEIIEAKRNHDFYSFGLHAAGLNGMIDGMYVNDLKIIGCELSRYGESAVVLGGNRSRNLGGMDSGNYYGQPRGHVTNVLLQCNFIDDAGGGGIRIDDYPKSQRDSRGFRQLPTAPVAGPDNNVIDRTAIYRIGDCFADTSGIYVSHGFNTIVSTNHVGPAPSHSILVGAKCARSHLEAVVVRNNTVVRSVQRLLDMGAIYTHGMQNLSLIHI